MPKFLSILLLTRGASALAIRIDGILFICCIPKTGAGGVAPFAPQPLSTMQ